MSLEKTCFHVNAHDNVAVILEDVVANEVVSVVGAAPRTILTVDAIEYGHKIALRDIPSGAPVTKYGICIGNATAPIRQGEWVHLHNCASAYDERSAKFDPHTGAVHDTVYE